MVSDMQEYRPRLSHLQVSEPCPNLSLSIGNAKPQLATWDIEDFRTLQRGDIKAENRDTASSRRYQPHWSVSREKLASTKFLAVRLESIRKGGG